MRAGTRDHRYVFVGGLHRSGTSLVNRLIARLPGVAAITDAPVPENEGVYLQGAIPHTARHGRPMHFATDPEQHLVEGGCWDSLETRRRLEADWDGWFAPAPWRVEKSPVNLTRMRLYQQLFPLSQFVLAVRHPEAVAASVSHWVDLPVPAMIDHWIAAHRRVAADLPYLHAVLVLRYEDVVTDPRRAMEMLAAFLDLGPVAADPGEPVTRGRTSPDACAPVSGAQGAELARWGYAPGGRTLPAPVHVRHYLKSAEMRVRRACFVHARPCRSDFTA